LRQELLTAMNLVNYNQDASQINGIAGLGSFASSKGGLFSVVGGNHQIIQSAHDQARTNHQRKCPEKPDVISHQQIRIRTIVGGVDGFDLYDADSQLVGHYDLVVLAAPLQMARIDFLIKSSVDQTVLQPMPLGRLVQHYEDEDGNPTEIPDHHEGHAVLPPKLPGGATRPYTQVVTTIVSNGHLQADYFGLEEEDLPRGIYMTKKGKAAEHNITAISQVSSSAEGGLYKIFSSDKLPRKILEMYLGDSVNVEYEKVWGGPHGGATPDYQGTGRTTPYLLYDGATGLEGHTKAGALYYPNAMELTFAAMEMSAVGAKAVAKLIAKRMEWIGPRSSTYEHGDEL
jgi:prenylcysteine oxidase/farnesylcysteine lyase